MGAFKNAATPPYDIHVIAEAMVGEFGMFPSRMRVWQALTDWDLMTDDMTPDVRTALTDAVCALARLISLDPGV